MKLYYSPGACSLAPHIVVNELGLKDIETVKIDKTNKPPEFARINPKGYIPLLMTSEGEPLSEAAVILQYVGDLKPDAGLIPRPGTFQRYKMMEMLNFIATELHKGFGNLWAVKAIHKDASAQEELRASTIKKLATRFDLVAEQLKGKPFLFGEQFTVADAYMFTVLSWTRILNVDMTRWPAIMGYLERIATRPAVHAAMKAEGLLK